MRMSDWSSDVCSSDLPQRRIVVVADPHADDEVAGIADEQRIAIVLAGARLAEIGDAEHRRAAGATVDRCTQHLFHIVVLARPEAVGAGNETGEPALLRRLEGETGRAHV